MWQKWYPKLYQGIGGRPWTFIFRDWFFGERRTTLVVMTLAVGWTLGALLPWWMSLMLGAGFILGHLIWGGRRKGASHG